MSKGLSPEPGAPKPKGVLAKRVRTVLRRAAKGCRITLGALGECVDADATSLDDAARVVADGGTWSNSELSDGDGPFERVLASMRGRTVLFNHAGAAFPSLLGPACAAALDAFELPVGVNVYCSGSGLATSAPGQQKGDSTSLQRELSLIHI